MVSIVTCVPLRASLCSFLHQYTSFVFFLCIGNFLTLIYSCMHHASPYSNIFLSKPVFSCVHQHFLNEPVFFSSCHIVIILLSRSHHPLHFTSTHLSAPFIHSTSTRIHFILNQYILVSLDGPFLLLVIISAPFLATPRIYDLQRPPHSSHLPPSPLYCLAPFTLSQQHPNTPQSPQPHQNSQHLAIPLSSPSHPFTP